ncbi:hypothetical protein BVG18_15420 [Acinetobacter lwoffii]|nr:hypothetical protein BVG18_15420 [Acinetobacter lwoffii]
MLQTEAPVGFVLKISKMQIGLNYLIEKPIGIAISIFIIQMLFVQVATCPTIKIRQSLYNMLT